MDIVRAEGDRLIEPLDIARKAENTLSAFKGENVVVLDMRKVSNVTDYFVLVTGNSAPHIKALADETQRALKKDGVRNYRVSGDKESQWMSIDFLDVVVHVFSSETRSYYALDELWSDAVRVS